MSYESIRLTREELYERVWSVPSVQVAKELGVSDVALGKVCKKLEVPKPYPGYWRQVRAGLRVKRPPLQPPGKGTPAAATFWVRPGGLVFKPQDPRTLGLIRSEGEPENRITVAGSLRGAHRLVRQTSEASGLLRKGPNAKPGHRAPPGLDVRVSRPLLRRALLILDALLKALEARGYSVEGSDEAGAPTRAVIGEEKVKFFLWEKDVRSEHVFTEKELAMPSYRRPERWVFTPSGRLTFTIDEYWDDYGKKNWRDKEGRPLEDQLNEVVIGLLTAAEGLRRQRLEREERERRRKEDEARRWEEERRRKEDEARRGALEQQAQRWRSCQNLRAFISSCEDELVARHGPLDPEGPGAGWLRWAHGHADSLDPFKNCYLEEAVRAEAPGAPPAVDG